MSSARFKEILAAVGGNDQQAMLVFDSERRKEAMDRNLKIQARVEDRARQLQAEFTRYYSDDSTLDAFDVWTVDQWKQENGAGTGAGAGTMPVEQDPRTWCGIPADIQIQAEEEDKVLDTTDAYKCVFVCPKKYPCIIVAYMVYSTHFLAHSVDTEPLVFRNAKKIRVREKTVDITEPALVKFFAAPAKVVLHLVRVTARCAEGDGMLQLTQALLSHALLKVARAMPENVVLVDAQPGAMDAHLANSLAMYETQFGTDRFTNDMASVAYAAGLKTRNLGILGWNAATVPDPLLLGENYAFEYTESLRAQEAFTLAVSDLSRSP